MSSQQTQIPDNILKRISDKLDGESIEQTKYTQVDRMSELDRLDFFTEYQDFKQVMRMNKIMTFTRIAPLVFGETDEVKEMLKVFTEHAIDHKLHMTSLNRKRALELVHALKNDDGVNVTRSGIQKFVGVRR